MHRSAFIALFVVLLLGLLFGQSGTNPIESQPAKPMNTIPHATGLPSQRNRRWLPWTRRRFAPK